MQINFSQAEEKFIQSQIQNGYYQNETELIKDAVRRLKEENEKKNYFVEAVMRGDEQIEQGKTVLFTPELFEEIAERAIKRAINGEKPNPDVTP